MSESSENQKVIFNFKEVWPQLNIIEKIEYVVSVVLVVIISAVVIIALIRLGKNVFTMLVLNALDPLDFKVFQFIFGNMLTLFIAIEFLHSIQGVLQRIGHIIEVRTILLIAMLAIARKFIVMDKSTPPETMAALAFILLALGGVYWILKNKRTI